MSIRHAILGLLSEGPMTGYEIAKRFEHSLSRVWPARPNQIYTELNRMADKGLIQEIGREARNARRYEIQAAGEAALQSWMTQKLPEGGGLRFEPLLKANFLWTLPQDQQRAWLKEQQKFWAEQIAWLDAQAKHLPPESSDLGSSVTSRRSAAVTGRKIYNAMMDWARETLP